ncbi:MAG: cytochrome C biogenesis protein [Flavobacteriales bacterium]|nr:cytochrome C biogenesis protein [Flavobacteriales bacterium]|tara:strand:- start:626 stop:1033 length:408 start_codon:yes stop_codon:yes gene_type:complete
MKKTEIVLILLVAVIIGIILSLTFNASTYVTFIEAEKFMGEEFTVIGELNKEKEIIYDPYENQLTFFALDSMSNQRKVFYYDAKPQDFERSEKITMTGFASSDGFVAQTILMKCPSKYNEDQHLVEEETTYLTYD